MERTLKDLTVEGVKTRKKPSKHIVFAVKVTWSDGQVNVVSRRYSEFFELMEKLNETFPVEAGKHDHNERILPNLQVLSISGPMSLEQYRVIADVRNECKTGLDLKEGQIVEVIEKLETGWWLVTADGEQGWVPASYLSNEDDPEEAMTTIRYQPGQGEYYVTNAAYTATLADELSFDIGVHLQVIEKNLDGWWRVIYNGCEGLVPATYLKKVGGKKSQCRNKPPPLRRKSVLSISRRYSVNPQGDMNVETLAKLRESTFKSPEEKEERMLPKRKLAIVEQKKIQFVPKTPGDENSLSESSTDKFLPKQSSLSSKEQDEDYDSSDEDICTLEDLLSEVKDKRRMSRESGSLDSGMESPSPPSSPVAMKTPHKSAIATSNMYVAIADYKGSKEDGEVDLFEGQQVRLLQKTAGGWWLVENDAEQEGWAPSNFLRIK